MSFLSLKSDCSKCWPENESHRNKLIIVLAIVLVGTAFGQLEQGPSVRERVEF